MIQRHRQRERSGEDHTKTNDSDVTRSSLEEKNETKTGTAVTTIPILLGGFVLRIALAVIAIIAWSTVLAKQNNGDFLVSHLYVQLGDATNLKLGTYSGVYVRSQRRDPDTKRFSFHSRHVLLGEHRGELLYCDPLKSWVFRDAGDKQNNGRPCGWMLKSAETTSFDVFSTASLQWFLDESFHVKTPAEWMYLTAYNPIHKPHETFCEAMSNSSRYGLNCEFTNPCENLTVNKNTNEFGEGFRRFPSEFRLVPELEIYHRPVYYGRIREGHVILFTGRRWVMISIQLPATTRTGYNTLAQRLATIGLTNDFQVPSFSGNQTMIVEYISEPVDATAPKDDWYYVTPTHLQWFPTTRSSLTTAFEVDGSRTDGGTRLVCATCLVPTEDANEEERKRERDGECLYNGTCQAGSNTCLCQFGSRGQICEVPPTGNGLCDFNFNQAAYDFDRGYV